MTIGNYASYTPNSFKSAAPVGQFFNSYYSFKSKNQIRINYFKDDSKTVTILKAFDGNNTIVFKKPMVLRQTSDQYGMYLDNDYLEIHCFGKSWNELSDDFNETIFSLEEQYLNCNEDELSRSGLKLREKLKEYYDGIQR